MRISIWTGAIFFPMFLTVYGFKSTDFKTCSQSGFCRRGRARAERAAADSSWKSPYSVDPSSIAVSAHEAAFKAAVKSSLYPDIKFELELQVHTDGVVRVRMDEVDGLRKRYDEAASWSLITEPVVSHDIKWTIGKKDVRAKYGRNNDLELVVSFDSLRITLLRNGKPEVVMNGLGLLHMEHFRTKAAAAQEPLAAETPEEGVDVEDAQVPLKVNPRAWFEGDTEDAYWEETFSSWTDSKPKGPESLSLDISFPRHGHIYGIPQHATRLDLPTTTGADRTYTDPYRLYNSDVFEYLASSPVSLYGSIPLMQAHSAESTVAIFNALASETWIDLAHPTEKSTATHWISESGILDIFILPGPTPTDIFAQYAALTGTVAMPAHWALAYHQCRWNYVSSDDVRSVQKRFDEEDMPVDVFWLDIEYAEDHKYFIWDQKSFPDPVDMTDDVSAFGRKMVVIVDPHLKRAPDYPVYKEASELGVLVKSKSGDAEYEGWCWPGSSAWLDLFNPQSWAFWKTLFKTEPIEDRFTWTESTNDVYIWNDMNEPSVFNGPEITMPKDNIHYGGWEHRDVHNLNGMLLPNLTSQALAARTDPPRRPFVLTRSFYAGSQRFGAMWTGDNMGTWEHMDVGIKMVLASNIAGMSFAGSDVGGFFGNPEPEMLVRWYQVGIFMPFFRAHAHIDTKRREPYLLDEPYKGIVRDLLRLRYSMLPIWYTSFHEASLSGLPVLRPHYVMFPEDDAGFGIDEQFFVGGSGLLVKPVVQEGITETTVYLPEDQAYYDYFTHHLYRGAASGKNVTLPSALHQVPVLVRGGSILATRERPRRSSPLMVRDPFTLRVALSKAGDARGELYIDDGVSFAYAQGEGVWRAFEARSEMERVKGSARKVVRVRSTPREGPEGRVVVSEYAKVQKGNAFEQLLVEQGVRVEKVVVVGISRPLKVRVQTEGAASESDVEWTWEKGITAEARSEGAAGVLVLKDPAVLIAKDWEIVIEM